MFNNLLSAPWVTAQFGPAAKKAAALSLNPTNLCSLVLLCLAAAALALALQTYQGNGMIFRWWRKVWLTLKFKGRAKRWITNSAPKPERKPANIGQTEFSATYDFHYQLARWQSEHVRHYSAPKWYFYLYKPLGGCVYCNGPWLLFPYYFLLTIGLFGWCWWLALLLLPLAVGIQFMAIELFSTISHHE